MMMYAKIVKLFLQSIFFLLICLSFIGFCLETDTITSGVSINDPDTIISGRQVFKLGFFTPDNSTKRYFGVFYTVSEKTVIWIANRDKPLYDSSGTVTISRDGNLVLMNGRNETIWSTNATITSPMNTSAQIQDTGNIVLHDISTGRTIWESFSYPSNVFMPTMQLVDNVNTDKKVVISSWKTGSDPGVGSFTTGLEALNIPQIFIWNNGRPYWRSGPWNGQILIGVQDMYSPYNDRFSVDDDPPGNFYFTAPEGGILMNFALNSSGSLVQTLWNDQKKNWDISWWAPRNECDVYATCGPFGSCNEHESPTCSCLRGFEPINREEWERGNWTSGCQRRRQLQCDQSGGGNGDGFLRLPFMKVPDFAEHFSSGQVEECLARCSRNCSCLAYAHDLHIGCMFWSESLIDLQKFSSVGVDLYIRLEASELVDSKWGELLNSGGVLALGGKLVVHGCPYASYLIFSHSQEEYDTQRSAYEADPDTSESDPQMTSPNQITKRPRRAKVKPSWMKDYY
ncbi:hypothetical protein BUALT_Bualt03G0067000 [Buddleja alternifolia]|uniref:non-specific serine/threonine protein kinase n=1 Tax=Buddleja alternifolia TaxID=168488 RepID=A0AAV6XRR7_9LAMI|nr:hypothetical protein BUALT_Bualt03G0067000 [Buddleja alternifolia]